MVDQIDFTVVSGVIEQAVYSGNQASFGEFDPATLSLTGWWRDFAGAPWVPSASAGTSGAAGNFTTLGSDPTTGTLNGHGTATYDGASNQLGSAIVPDTLWTTTAGTIIVLFNAAAAHADSGAWYGEPAFVSTTVVQELGLQYSSAGVVAGDYDGTSFNRLPVVASTGSWHCASFTWDGAQMRVRVDNGSFSTQATNAIGTLSFGGDTVSTGSDANTHTVFYNGQIAEIMTANTVISDADLDNIRSYMNTRYGIAI